MAANEHPEAARHRAGPPVRGLLALVAAVTAAGTLVAQAPGDSRPARPPARTVDSVWPDARRGDVPGTLPGGAAYSPAYFLDERASVGTALDPSGDAVRLVLRAAGGAVRVLRQLPTAGGPQFAGFTAAGGELVWAESITDRGSPRTALWRVDVASAAAPRKITDDTGDATFFNSEYDMVVESGRLYWTAAAPGREAVTEVRSVPLRGGTVEVRTEPGAWALSAWPWLVSADNGQSGPVRMRDLVTGRETAVDATGDEQVTCDPTWCRVITLPADGPARSDLMRPDGSDRRRVADDGATASIIDVVVLDRFEVLSGDSGTLATAVGGQRLSVYDVTAKRLATVAEAAGRVSYRGGVLWWSTGAGQTAAWHTLDLRSLP